MKGLPFVPGSEDKSIVETVRLSAKTVRNLTEEGRKLNAATPPAFVIPHVIRTILDRLIGEGTESEQQLEADASARERTGCPPSRERRRLKDSRGRNVR